MPRTQPRRVLTRLGGATLMVAIVVGVNVAVVPAANAAPTFYTWTGDGDGTSWTNAMNWMPNDDYPKNGDAASIRPVELGCAQAHVTNAPFNLTLLSLSLSDAKFGDSICNASLDGGPLTVAGSYTQNAAVMNTELTVLSTATASITSTLPVPIHPQVNADLTVDGSLTVAGEGGDALYIGGGTTIEVSSGASIRFVNNADIVGTTCCVDPPRLTNNGTMHLDDHLDISAAQFDQNGVLATTGNGSLSTDSAPATGGGGASYTGPGYWEMGSATTTTMADTQTLGRDFRLILGGPGISGTNSLSGKFSLAGTGTFEWRGGQLQADLTVGAGVRVKAAGNPGAGRFLTGRDRNDLPITVTNHGAMSFTDGADYYNLQGGTVINASDGTLNLGPGTTIEGDCCGSPGLVRNLGGRVNVPTGPTPATLHNVSFATVGGTTSIAPAQRLKLTGGARDVLAGPTITGGGILDIASPTTLQGGAQTAANTTLLLRAFPGTLNSNAGTATLSGAGRFLWRGGEMSGAIDIDTSGVSLIGPPLDPANEPVAKYVLPQESGAASLIRFKRSVTMLAGNAEVPNQIDVPTDSRLVFAGTTTLNSRNLFTGGGAVNNFGSMRIMSTSALPVAMASAFFNRGDLSIDKGRLQVADVFLAAGTVTVADGATLASTRSDPTIRLSAGTLRGIGRIEGDLLNVKGLVSPGLGGKGRLTITGNFIQESTGSLAFRLGRGSDGTSLLVESGVLLRGRLRLSNAYTPTASSSERPLTSGEPMSVRLGCTTTSGQGATGDKARHWVGKVVGRALVLRSVKGRQTSC